ncbi:MAG TPA: S8 family serine peptidase [Blastocatellia bacterium]|nr:S8 family serine peptidase [Blastocatellia bacterium]
MMLRSTRRTNEGKPAGHHQTIIRLIGLALILFICVWWLLPAAAEKEKQEQISLAALQQIEALAQEKESRTPAQQKIDSHLLLALKVRRGDPLVSAVPAARQNTALADSAGRTLVDIRAEVSKELLSKIEQLGGEVVSSFARYKAIRARLPLDSLEALAGEAAVRFIAPADEGWTNSGKATNGGAKANPPLPRGLPVTRAEQLTSLREQLAAKLAAFSRKTARPRAGTALTGLVNSEGDVAHRADQVRALGINGTGIRIGVMSDGVDSLAAEQALGELPGTVTVVPGQAGSGDEGTAMLEIVYDLAPGATLFFATAGGGLANMASNITTLAGAPYNCDIIVDDFTYRSEGVFQDDVISQAVNTVSAAGVLFFSSAGNSGNLNDGTSGVWEGDFADGGTLALLPGGNVHDFGGGVIANNLTAAAAAGRRVALKWSDPLGASNNDYDLYILNSTLTAVLDSSTNTQNGTQDPYETSNINEAVGHRLVIFRKTGAATRALHLNTNRGRLQFGTSGQVFGHNAAGAANAFSVSATNVGNAGGGVFTGGAANPVETFTSDGLRRIFFTPGGTAITPGNVLFSTNGGQVLNKPDITAADCGSTNAPGFLTFCGTSAAAPHAAAVAALVWSFNPALTPAQVRTALQNSALDIEANGYDRDAGFGIVMALQAVSAVSSADLAITKTDAPDPVIAGNNLTYTINAVNNGTGPAAFIQISDNVPGGATFVSLASPAGWTCTAPAVGGTGPITCKKDTMAVNETAAFTLVVRVDSCAAQGANISNTATISSTTTDPDGTNNSATATTAVIRRADLSITKAGAPATVIAGNGQIIYTINATNNGPSCAQNLQISDTIPTNTRFVSAVASAGAALVTPPVGGSGAVTATWNGDTTVGQLRTLTITVRVCAEVACNTEITNTATVSSLTVDPVPGNNSATSNPTKVQAQSDLAITKTGDPNPVIAGRNVTYTLKVTNNGPSNSISTVVTDVLPKGFTVVSLNTTAGTISASPVDPVTLKITVTANLGTLGAAGQCATSFPTMATITIVAGVPVKYPVVTVTNTANVVTGNCLPDPDLTNNQASFDTTVFPDSSDPGLPDPATSGLSDQRAGSVLVYNIYTSSISNPAQENTRINLTNISAQEAATVHIFFVDGRSCSVADSLICLSPNQTAMILASDVDPGVTGYIIAVAVDSDTGLPRAFNCLIGDEYVKFSSGHTANLGAEAIPALMIYPAGANPNVDTATLRFDGMNYAMLPRVLAVDSLPSQVDGNSTLLIVDRIGGDLRSSLDPLGPMFAILYDELEHPFSFQFTGSCQFLSVFNNTSFPRTTPRLNQILPAGAVGWMRFRTVADAAMLGAVINFNRSAGASQNAYNQGHNLHKLTLTGAASLTVPVFAPNCR